MRKHLFHGIALYILSGIVIMAQEVPYGADKEESGYVPSSRIYIPLLNNQPIATEGCPITNTVTTELLDANGESTGVIGVRNYKCEIGKVVWSVSVPKACENGGCGLILDIHGAVMNARVENNGTMLREYGMLADSLFQAETPYVVIQPNYTNLIDFTAQQGDIAGFESIVGNEYKPISLTIDFVKDAINAFKIDKSRVHATGFSRGGKTVEAIYCDDNYRPLFASFAIMGADGPHCGIKENKPLMMINGIIDIAVLFIDLTFNAEKPADQNAAQIQALPDYQYTLLAEDPSWKTIIWPFIFNTGKELHERHEAPGYLFESIKHSGATFLTFGHCIPNTKPMQWLTCHATFDSGAKLTKFFVDNPLIEAKTEFPSYREDPVLFYPNPANGYTFVKVKNITSQELIDLSFFNMSGEQVYSLKNMKQTQWIDTSFLKQGIYNVVASYGENKNKKSSTRLLVK